MCMIELMENHEEKQILSAGTGSTLHKKRETSKERREKTLESNENRENR